MVKPFFGIKQQHQLDKCTDFCKVHCKYLTSSLIFLQRKFKMGLKKSPLPCFFLTSPFTASLKLHYYYFFFFLLRESYIAKQAY